MENLTARVAKILGVPSESCWSQLFAFMPQDPEKKSKRGTFLVAFSFSGGEEAMAASFGREILSRLNEEYYGELESDILTKLKKTLARVSEEIGQETKIEIVTGVLKGNTLYLAILGHGQAYLYRDGKIGKVLQGEGELISASGKLQEGDIFLLGTSQVFALTSEGVLRVAFESGSLQDAVEILTPTLLGKDGEAGVAAILAKTEKEILLDEQEEITSPQINVEEKSPKIEEPKETISEELSENVENLVPPIVESPTKPPVFGKKTSFLEKITEKFSQFPGNKIYLRDGDDSRKKKVNLTVALILIGLLSISLFFGTKKRNADLKEEKFKTLAVEMNNLLDESQGLAALDPNRSQEIYLQAQSKYQELQNLGINQAQLVEFKNKIDQVQKVAVKENRLENIPTFYDLELITKDVKGDKLALIEDQLYILDKNANRVLSLNLSKKSGSVYAGSLNSTENMAGETKLYVLGENGVDGVASGKSSTVIKAEGWGKVTGMANFNTSLYLLDSEAKNIWRYQATDAGFGSKKAWLTTEEEKLAKGNSLVIDGSLWVGTTDGRIYKFNQGQSADFAISGLDKNFGEIKALYTNSDIENLYVLDFGRLTVLSKSGELVNTYLSDSLNSVSDIVFWQKKALLLSGNKLLEISFN